VAWCNTSPSSSSCYPLSHSINAIGPAPLRSGRNTSPCQHCIEGVQAQRADTPLMRVHTTHCYCTHLRQQHRQASQRLQVAANKQSTTLPCLLLDCKPIAADDTVPQRCPTSSQIIDTVREPVSDSSTARLLVVKSSLTKHTEPISDRCQTAMLPGDIMIVPQAH
jgi:hypothetical protein